MEQFLANGLCKGAVYGIISIGFFVICKTTGVFHIAHAAICASAAYAAYICLIKLHLGLPLSLLVAAISAGMLGIVVDVVVYKPLQKRKASPLILLISSLGTNVVLTNCLVLFFGSQPISLYPGPQPTTNLWGVILTQTQVRQVELFLLLAVGYLLIMRFGSLGRLCTALADNPMLASVLGMDVARIRAYLFLLGSSLAGVGSALFALDVGAEPSSGMPLMFSSVAACIIGGLRHHESPIVGALLLGLAQGLVTWRFASNWEGAITFFLVILIFLFRDQGVLSVTRRAEEV